MSVHCTVLHYTSSRYAVQCRLRRQQYKDSLEMQVGNSRSRNRNRNMNKNKNKNRNRNRNRNSRSRIGDKGKTEKRNTNKCPSS